MERGSPVDRENVVARENLGIAPFEVFRNVIRAIVGNGRMHSPGRVAEDDSHSVERLSCACLAREIGEPDTPAFRSHVLINR